MGITRAADCRVNVVDIGGVEVLRREVPGSVDDEAGGADRVGIGVARFARPDFGEEDLRDCPPAVVFGWLAFMLAS